MDSEDGEDREGLYSDKMNDRFEGDMDKSSTISHPATEEDDRSTVKPVSGINLVAKKKTSRKFCAILDRRIVEADKPVLQKTLHASMCKAR